MQRQFILLPSYSEGVEGVWRRRIAVQSEAELDKPVSFHAVQGADIDVTDIRPGLVYEGVIIKELAP
jgi:hypothetical protein